MASRCEYCAGLSIVVLVNLARQEFSGRKVPKKAVYHHHKSLFDLESSANSGCDLCTLLLECYKNIRYSEKDFFRASKVKEKIELTNKLENSLFYKAKDLPLEGIKICINTHHLSTGESLSEELVFDQIYIRLVDARAQHWTISPTTLVLTLTASCRNEEVYVGKHRVGRFPIDPDLGSPGNFDIARTWLKTCQEKHTTCWEKHGIYQRMAKLPTRVIDVGPNEESGILRIICPRGESGQYVTLSHCWGGEITPLLTEHTIKDFQQSLLFDDLPANFRDAIIVTRQLGIRYLWIDSLCILQDSKTDWEAESKKMGLYYGQSTLTVLAQCSESSTQGFLKSWVDIWKKTNPIKLDVASGGNDNRQVTVEWLPYEREDILFLKENDSPLASRGWTLQEDLLSPRKLYYGKQQIHWKCYETTTSAEGVPSRNYELLDQVNSPRGLPFDYKVVSSVLKDGPLSEARRHPVDTEDLLREYYDLLHMYSMRQFTKESDRLPAFSGLAQQIHKCLEGEYLAGIWSCDPDRGLHWCRYRDDMEAAGGLDAGEQRGLRTSKQRRKLCAPSWSWASASRPIKFDVSPHTPNSFQLELLSYHMEYQDQSNPYGQVKAGRLSVRGYTIPVVEKTQVPLMMYCGSIDFDDPGTDKFGKPCIAQARLYRVENEDNEVASFAVQKVLGDESKEGDNVVSPPQEHILLALGVKGISQGVMLTKMGCILLRKITTREDDLFERIGFISLSVINLDTHMSDWSQRELTII